MWLSTFRINQMPLSSYNTLNTDAGGSSLAPVTRYHTPWRRNEVDRDPDDAGYTLTIQISILYSHLHLGSKWHLTSEIPIKISYVFKISFTSCYVNGVPLWSLPLLTGSIIFFYYVGQKFYHRDRQTSPCHHPWIFSLQLRYLQLISLT
jgi:hypothetical protein